MRRGVVTSLLLLLFVGLPAWAGEISPNDVAPTQPYAGFDNIQDMVGRWKAEAAKSVGKPAANLTSGEWRGWVQGTLKPRMEGKTIPGIVDPSGHFRNLDAHHRVGALQLVYQETGVDFQLPTDVQADFRGKSRGDMDRWVERKGLTFPGGPIRNSTNAGASANWPVRFQEIRDSPLRSAVGNALYNLGIDSVHGKPYLEFEIANLLERGGIVKRLKKMQIIGPQDGGIPSGMGTDPRVVKVVERMIITSKPVRRFMETEAPIERRATILKQYRKAKKSYGKNVAQMPPQQRKAEVGLLGMLKARLTLPRPPMREGIYRRGLRLRNRKKVMHNLSQQVRVRGSTIRQHKFSGNGGIGIRPKRHPSARQGMTFNKLLSNNRK